MAKSTIARRKGDEYQARVFWINALKLRTTPGVESVEFERDDVSFMDDVVVVYREPQRWHVNGKKILCDAFQCKYHMTVGGAYTADNLVDPEFISSKRSMAERLYEAFLQLNAKGSSFRLNLCSNYNWHPDDPLSGYLHEGTFRHELFSVGPGSDAGKALGKLGARLKLNREELARFLETICFRAPRDLQSLAEEMVLLLQLASLRPIDPTSSNIEYDDLVWKLFSQGRGKFNKAEFNAMVLDEGLIADTKSKGSEISIQSFALTPGRPSNLLDDHLDLRPLFVNGIEKDSSSWAKEIPDLIKAFLLTGKLGTLSKPINLFFDCHLSIAFAAGYLLTPKAGLPVVPIQKGRSGFVPWEEPAAPKVAGWEVTVSGPIDNEATVEISVTHVVTDHIDHCLDALGLAKAPRIVARPVSGTGPQSVPDGLTAWSLSYEIANELKKRVPSSCKRLHVFMSTPSAMAFILGNRLRGIVPELQLYEHDFEGQTDGPRYRKGMRLSAK